MQRRGNRRSPHSVKGKKAVANAAEKGFFKLNSRTEFSIPMEPSPRILIIEASSHINGTEKSLKRVGSEIYVAWSNSRNIYNEECNAGVGNIPISLWYAGPSNTLKKMDERINGYVPVDISDLDLDGLQGFISNKQRHAIDYMHEKFFPGGLGDEVSEYFMSLENPRTRRRMDDASPNDEIRQGLDYIVSYPEDPEIQDIYKILTEAYVRKSLMPYIDNGEITYVSDIVISPVFPGREKVRAGIIIAFPDDASSSIYKNIANTLGAKIYNNGLEINTSNY